MKYIFSYLLFPLLLVTSLLTVSCNEGNTAATGTETAVNVRDSVNENLLKTIGEIYQNLELIREKEHLISSGNNETTDKKEEILRTISLINTLLEENRKKIERLEKQEGLSKKSSETMKKLAMQTRSTMEKQEQQVLELKQQLAMEEFKVMDLNVQMDELQVAGEKTAAERDQLQKINESLEKDLNKVYITYGTYEQLKEKNIVSSRMIGGSRKSNLLPDFSKNRSWYTEMDRREIKQFPVKGVKPRMLTLHPEDSYEWKSEGEFTRLNITDPEAFWSVSRFLVIQVQ